MTVSSMAVEEAHVDRIPVLSFHTSPELKVSTPAHAKHLGWHGKFSSG